MESAKQGLQVFVKSGAVKTGKGDGILMLVWTLGGHASFGQARVAKRGVRAFRAGYGGLDGYSTVRPF